MGCALQLRLMAMYIEGYYIALIGIQKYVLNGTPRQQLDAYGIYGLW